MYAQIKRLAESWKVDGHFEKKLLENEEKTLAEYNIKLSKDILAKFCDKNDLKSFQQCTGPYGNKVCAKFDAYVFSRTFPLIKSVLEQPTSFGRWTKRQHNRNLLQFSYPENIFYHFFNTELSKGCTNQCWFCGLSAPKYEKYYHYDHEVWCALLRCMQQLLGNDAMQTNLCYWASEPFDNPDYEKFILDYKNVLGVLPYTQTASAAKNIERTRAFLKINDEARFQEAGFSVLSKEDLMTIYHNFSAEELEKIEVRIQFNHKCRHKVCFGRARKEKKQESAGEYFWTLLGFLVNMVDKKIQLTMPAIATDARPCGGIILDEKYFTTIDDFKEKVELMIKNNMIDKILKSDIRLLA